MNHIFKAFLRRFVLVFFDDILIYSTTEQEHLIHLNEVLKILRDNRLYATQSKCCFFQTDVEYLGHIIFGQEVKTDPRKIEVMVNWPTPQTIKALRGFLGLTGYYASLCKITKS